MFPRTRAHIYKELCRLHSKQEHRLVSKMCLTLRTILIHNCHPTPSSPEQAQFLLEGAQKNDGVGGRVAQPAVAHM